MTEDASVAEAKKELGKSNEVKAKIVAEAYSRFNARPTPTQEEADLVALGVAVTEKEPDGSPEDPRGVPIATRVLAASPNPNASGYATRAHRSARSETPSA
jgi:hypothetical protein